MSTHGFKISAIPLALLCLLSMAWILLSDDASGNLRMPKEIEGSASVEEQRHLLANLGEFSDPKSVVARSTNLETDIVPEMQQYAIFLISFGEEAAESTYVERCVLSARRRGAWQGAIVVLTDAPKERYEGFFDENVFIVHPKKEHFLPEGYFDYGEMNYKRFKTYIIDYVKAVPELDKVEWIYYIDIDVLFGAPFIELAYVLESRYNLNDIPEHLSKLYFFENAWDKFILQGGFFVLHRRNSKFCLDAWRQEIDNLPHWKFDQMALNQIFENHKENKEMRCHLITMERDNYMIEYPTSDEEVQALMDAPRLPNLIHIRNTYTAVHYTEGLREDFIAKVLELTEEEKKDSEFTKTTHFGASADE